jgi:hypothetical protein
MDRHITMLFISILLVFALAACNPGTTAPLTVPENLVFTGANHRTDGPTRITFSDRELIFYPMAPNPELDSQEFMMVDIMGDRSIEYILRNDRLEEARFSLPDGSLVRFDLVGLQENGLAPIIYHCTAHSSALYQMDWLPGKLSDSITNFTAVFADWSVKESGTLHLSREKTSVPYESILETVCCGVGLI